MKAGKLNVIFSESRTIVGSREWELKSTVRCVLGRDVDPLADVKTLGLVLIMRHAVHVMNADGLAAEDEEAIDVWIACEKLAPEATLFPPANLGAAVRVAVESATRWHLHVAAIFDKFPKDILTKYGCTVRLPTTHAGRLVSLEKEYPKPARDVSSVS